MSYDAPSARVQVVVATHPGQVRDENQDQFCVNGLTSGGSAVSPMTVGISGDLLAAVVDGMGGHAGGRTAARLVAEVLCEPEAAWDGLVDRLHSANSRLHGVMGERPDLVGMGATVVLVMADRHGWTVFNVGDARAYLHQEGYSVVVSTDDRARGEHGVITQSLGGTDRLTTLDPHVAPIDVKVGDRVLLCSDGLSDVVPLSRIQAVLDSSPAEAAVQQLLEAALEAGAPDNVTLVLLEPLELPMADVARSDQGVNPGEAPGIDL